MAICFGAASGAMAQHCTAPAALRSKLSHGVEPAVLNELGVWFAEHKQFECAAQAFGTSLQNDSAQQDLPHVAFMFGASLYYSGDTKEAAPSLQEAERLGYRDIKLHLLLAAALDQLDARTDAEAEWRQALEFEPESTAALDALSADLLINHKYQDTIDLLVQPRIQPQRSIEQFVRLGFAYVNLKRYDEAVSVLQDGFNTYPASSEIADLLASVLVELHRPAEADRVRQLAAAQAPSTEKTRP